MKKNIKEILLRIIILLIGLTIAHFGVNLFLLADLGADPFNVFIQGLFRTIKGISITHGTIHMSICFIIIIILLIVDRTYIKIGTIICMFCGGPIIDLFTYLLEEPFSHINSLYVNILINGLGCVILAFGMTIVIKSDAGTGPNDLIAIVVSDKLKKNFGITRIIIDVLFAVAGILLGGDIGIGTVICAFLVGSVANWFLPVNEKWINKLLKKM